ncbi:hypothetical protein [Actinokineospora inagensis]|uniref:hypothetical protein n=1 Tax=Actinokineospora inagensis TaxID=103730 RepID=UPI000479C740|nr:hypothetical protein [Actinokineospora inagensis]
MPLYLVVIEEIQSIWESPGKEFESFLQLTGFPEPEWTAPPVDAATLKKFLTAQVTRARHVIAGRANPPVPEVSSVHRSVLAVKAALQTDTDTTVVLIGAAHLDVITSILLSLRWHTLVPQVKTVLRQATVS